MQKRQSRPSAARRLALDPRLHLHNHYKHRRRESTLPAGADTHPPRQTTKHERRRANEERKKKKRLHSTPHQSAQQNNRPRFDSNRRTLLLLTEGSLEQLKRQRRVRRRLTPDAKPGCRGAPPHREGHLCQHVQLDQLKRIVHDLSVEGEEGNGGNKRGQGPGISKNNYCNMVRAWVVTKHRIVILLDDSPQQIQSC